MKEDNPDLSYFKGDNYLFVFCSCFSHCVMELTEW